MNKKQSERWYKSKRWQSLRKAQLAKHPYCQCQHHDGQKILAADERFGGAVVDHNPGHKEDRRAFFDTRRLRSMTKQCHDSFRQSEEKGGAGFLKGCDEQGWPLSKEHEWHTDSQR